MKNIAPKTRIKGLPEGVRATVRAWVADADAWPLYLALEEDGSVTAAQIPRGTMAHLVGTPPVYHYYVETYYWKIREAQKEAARELTDILESLAADSLDLLQEHKRAS